MIAGARVSRRLSVMSALSASAGTRFTVERIDRALITFSYDTLAGNNPREYRNWAAIWQNPDVIAWQQPPLWRAPVRGTTPAGTAMLPASLDRRLSYVIAWWVGPTVQSACSTVFIPARGAPEPCSAGSITVPEVYAHEIVVSYVMPTLSTPHTFGHWIGVWRGAAAPYSLENAVVSSPIESDNASDVIAVMTQETFAANTTYTIAYFAGPGPTTMACTHTFTTGP